MTTDFHKCEQMLTDNKYDILWNGVPSFGYYFKFLANGIVESNQTMFDGLPWKAVNDKQFTINRKNGSQVLWEFKSLKTGSEAFRTDKPLFGLRLVKN